MICRTAIIMSLAAAAPALAQTAAPQAATPQASASATTTVAAQPTPGMTVTGPAGAAVGTVTAVQGSNVVIKTDKYDVSVPLESMRIDADKAVVGVTREQLNAGIEQMMAKVNQLMVAGSTVYGPAGNVVGTIETVEPQFVTVKLTSQKTVRLPRGGFAAGPNGLLIGLTQAQIEAQLPS